jgi:hypothetical protein
MNSPTTPSIASPSSPSSPYPYPTWPIGPSHSHPNPAETLSRTSSLSLLAGVRQSTNTGIEESPDTAELEDGDVETGADLGHEHGQGVIGRNEGADEVFGFQMVEIGGSRGGASPRGEGPRTHRPRIEEGAGVRERERDRQYERPMTNPEMGGSRRTIKRAKRVALKEQNQGPRRQPWVITTGV